MDQWDESVVGRVTEATISGLMISTSYYILVAAVNSAGTGKYSLHIIVKTLSVAVDSLSFTHLNISWVLDYRSTTTSYTISYSNTNTDCFTDSDNITGIAASETMYTLTDLPEGTEYSITVTALLSDGETAEDNITATTMTAG